MGESHPIVVSYLALAPLWVAIVFAVFVLRRRKFSFRMLMFFVTLEALALGVSVQWGWPLLRPHF
jgi:hypothetical protein